MRYYINLAFERFVLFDNLNIADFGETQRLGSVYLLAAASDKAFCECDFQLCHYDTPLTFNGFGADSPHLSNLFNGTQIAESSEGSLNDIGGVIGTQAFAAYIPDSDRIENGTH